MLLRARADAAQIYDVSIDRVNKPFLPLAAGDMSLPVAWAAVLALAAGGAAIVATQFGQLIVARIVGCGFDARGWGPPFFDALLQGLYSFGLFLGTIYSVPPLRLKARARDGSWPGAEATRAAFCAARVPNHRHRARFSAQLRRVPRHARCVGSAV